MNSSFVGSANSLFFISGHWGRPLNVRKFQIFGKNRTFNGRPRCLEGVMRMWSNLIGSVIVLVGVCASLDSRRLVRKYFDFGEENTAVLGLKIVGVLIILAGVMLIISSQQ